MKKERYSFDEIVSGIIELLSIGSPLIFVGIIVSFTDSLLVKIIAGALALVSMAYDYNQRELKREAVEELTELKRKYENDRSKNED